MIDEKVSGLSSACWILLNLGVIGLWARTYWRSDSVSYSNDAGFGFISVLRGRVVESFQPSVSPPPYKRPARWQLIVPTDGTADFTELSGSPFRSNAGHYFTSMARDREWWSFPLWWVPETLYC